VTGASPSDARLAELGLCAPNAPDAADRRDLVRYLLTLGATVDEIRGASGLGELALDMTLRPREPLTLREVVEGAGVSWPVAERMTMAIGLTTDPDARVTAAEAEAVRLLSVSADILGEEATVQLARVTGSAVARVAETIVAAFRLQVELPRRAGGTRYVDLVKEYTEFARTTMPSFTSTFDAVLRRQIVAAAERMWSTDEEQSAVMLPRTVGFADLVGYTEVSASMSVRRLTDLLMAFDERTAEVVTRRGGQLVKTIGDEALFVTENVADACAIALELVRSFGHDGSPPVRVGLARGEVVSVLGDVFGPDVNLAARLVQAAEPETVVASEGVRSAAGVDLRFEEMPPLSLKGIPGPTRAYRLVG
jgi:adenylate cyclase